MDFIERIFGISPDNGSGTFEGSLLVIVIVIAAAIYYYRRSKSATKIRFRDCEGDMHPSPASLPCPPRTGTTRHDEFDLQRHIVTAVTLLLTADFWKRLAAGSKEICRVICMLLCRLAKGRLPPRPPVRNDCCIQLPPDVYKRADPLIYSQYYLMAQGLAVTWDNPGHRHLRRHRAGHWSTQARSHIPGPRPHLEWLLRCARRSASAWRCPTFPSARRRCLNPIPGSH